MTRVDFKLFADLASEGQALNSLSELGEVVGGNDLIEYLPDDLKDSSQLVVQQFEVGMQTGEEVDITVEVAVGMENAWTVIEGLFVVQKVQSTFYVENPFTPARRSVDFALMGEMVIGGGTLDVSAAFSEDQQLLSCVLKEGESVDLLAVFNALGVPLGEVGVDEFACSAFSIEIDALSKSYHFQIGLDANWELFGGDSLVLRQLTFDAIAVFNPSQNTYDYEVQAFGRVSLGGAEVSILAQYDASLGWRFSGNTEGRLSLTEVVSDLAQGFGTSLPDVLAEPSLSISELNISFNTRSKDFYLACQTQFKLDGRPLDLALVIDIRRSTTGYQSLFGGVLTIYGKQFALQFTKDAQASRLLAAFKAPAGADINLVDFLNAISRDAFSLEDEYNLTTLTVYLLQLRYEQQFSPAITNYQFVGDFAWRPDIDLGLDGELMVNATVELKKLGNNPLSGTICGSIQTPIPLLEFLRMGACYTFSGVGSLLTLQLEIGELLFEAVYTRNSRGDTELLFSVSSDGSLSLGDMINFFASLVDPTIDEFEFDPPWNFLMNYDLTNLLEAFDFKLTIERRTNKKTFAFIFDGIQDLVPGSLRPIIDIDNLSLVYRGQQQQGASSRQFDISLDAKFLGVLQKLEWDPINENPPEIPGQGTSVFELRYLGLGQHVAFTGVQQVTSIQEVMGLLRGVIDEGNDKLKANRGLKNRNPLELYGDSGPIAFSPESDWLIGADLTLLKMLNFSVIFNDPLIYGLRIELYGKTAQNFAGLQFEILYRKVTDTIGVYHIDLTLPDFVRYLQFGSVSITLPVLVLDIYTNGDFKVDLGFPWNFNFARSFSLEIFPFVGSGGIYFNKLSAATATSTPAVVGGDAQGVFTPVYEFGVGLRVGLGKSFNKGPLKAEISITVQGLLEGVISWYNPRLEGERELYYLFRGGIAIVGRLYGSVDFGIIRVDVEVLAEAKVVFVVEVYRKIYLTLSARVSVRASVKVAFVRIRFSFSLQVVQRFTIGSDQVAPWEIEPGTRQVAARVEAQPSFRRSLPSFDWSQGLRSEGDGSAPLTLDIFFQPAFTWTPEGVKGEALFFIERATHAASDDQKDFDQLVKLLLRWTAKAYGLAEDTELLTLELLEELYEFFADADNAIFSYAELITFLGQHVHFRISECTTDIEGSLFPVFPQFSMTLGDSGEALNFEAVPWQLGKEDVRDLKHYFNQLKVQFELEQANTPEARAVSRGLDGKTAITEFVFADYFRLLIRSALQVARDHVQEAGTPSLTMKQLVDELGGGDGFQQVAGMASRFFLYGLRLPRLSDALTDQALYAATGQQFALDAAAATDASEGAGYRMQVAETPLGTGETAALSFEFPSAEGLTYFLRDTEDKAYPKYILSEQVRQLQAQTVEGIDLPSAQLQALPFHRREALNFALRKWIPLEGSNTSYVLPFPSSLNAYLLEKAPNPAMSLLRSVPGQANDALVTEAVALADFSWAVQLEVRVRSIPDAEGFLPDTFSLFGMSEAEHDLLQAVWMHQNDAAIPADQRQIGLSLLRVAQAGSSAAQLVSLAEDNASIRLFKTNLSTQSNSGSATRSLARSSGSGGTYFAQATEPESFLQLLWEAFTVNSGGYYLHVPGTSNALGELFGSETEATLILLVEYVQAGGPILDFHNALVYRQGIAAGDLLLVQSEEERPVLSLPAGHVGLQLTRPEPAEDFPEVTLSRAVPLRTQPAESAAEIVQLPAATVVTAMHTSNDGQWLCVLLPSGQRGWLPLEGDVLEAPDLSRNELANLYQLLGYQVLAHTRFKQSDPGLPLGPTGEGTWTYERVLPVYSLFQQRLPAEDPSLPPPSSNPYLGIAADAELKVRSWWQDLYGNPLLNTAQEALVPVAYTDPLLGIGQWPSVAESYAFLPKNEQEVTLVLELSFDPTPYAASSHADPDVHLDKVKAALETYRKVYYQLSQADTQVRAELTLLKGVPARRLRTSDLLDTFVAGIYRHLEGIRQSLENRAASRVAPPPPYVERFDIAYRAGDALHYPEAFIFEVGVALKLQRELNLIHSDLKDGDLIKSEHEDVLFAQTFLSPKLTAFRSNTLNKEAGQSLEDLAQAASTLYSTPYTSLDLLTANRSRSGLLAGGIELKAAEVSPDFKRMQVSPNQWEAYQLLQPVITTVAGETFDSLVQRFQADLQARVNELATFELRDLAVVLAGREDVLANGVTLALPAGEASLKGFAQNFEAAFSGLKLAVSDLPSRSASAAEATQEARRSLWAVRLGEGGITYDIQATPVFFAIPPLANSLLSGKVRVDDYEAWKGVQLGADAFEPDSLSYQPEGEQQQVDATDINVLARDFLAALEAFLAADTLADALAVDTQRPASLLAMKERLAHAISQNVQAILAKDQRGLSSDQLTQAQEAIKQQLLIHLVDGYEVETIVQYGVQLVVSDQLGANPWDSEKAPRLVGKPLILAAFQGSGDERRELALQELDASLSGGKIALRERSGTSHFTCLFDTRSPEKFSNVALQLKFSGAEIEYNVSSLAGVEGYESSSWLSFILPDPADAANDMGTHAIPIPLRNYPMPPSLILQQAEPDPDSERDLSRVRQWTYSCLYEHPDVAQDTIDCVIQLNVPPPLGIQARSAGPLRRNLFEALINFSSTYPGLAADLALPQGDSFSDADKQHFQLALTAFEDMVREVTTAWESWSLQLANPGARSGDLHYEIREEIRQNSETGTDSKLGFVRTVAAYTPLPGADAPEPTLALPTFFPGQVLPDEDPDLNVYQFAPNPDDQRFFGDSSIPDRKFSVDNLDVIHQQNAWGTIWLSRNKQLVPDEVTNPMFVFRTPEVKFNSKITPSLVNDERWDINALAPEGEGVDRSLFAHLQRLFGTLLPAQSENEYEVRLSCEYGFVMRAGRGLSQDLFTRLPVLMGLRLSRIEDAYIQALADQVEAWRAKTRPSETHAAYLFSVNLFSKLTPESRENLPLLRIEHLQLNLADIA